MSNPGALIMAVVAAVALVGAIVVATRKVLTEAGVYGRRITATMLFALAAILSVYDYALWSWGPAR